MSSIGSGDQMNGLENGFIVYVYPNVKKYMMIQFSHGSRC